MEHIANAWGDLLVLLIVFCKIDKLTLFKHKTDKYSNQNKLFSVHFQEMPGFKGKGKRGLTLTLYKTKIRYRLPVSPPRKRTKQVAVNTKFKIPINQDTKFIKKISCNFKISFQTGLNFPHLFGATFLLKMTETSPQIYTNYNITWFQSIHRSNVNKHSLSASSHE